MKILLWCYAAQSKRIALGMNISHIDSHFRKITSVLNTRTLYQCDVKVSNTHCYAGLPNPFFSKSEEKWKIKNVKMDWLASYIIYIREKNYRSD